MAGNSLCPKQTLGLPKTSLTAHSLSLSSKQSMSEVQTLEILEEISSLVTDRLQVVSYKWLSRNFLVSSNAAKKLLQEFVEKRKDALEAVYIVAGWLRKAPTTYHISLIPGPKLAEAKHAFDDNCSIQVYSVQACIPKDPVAIWNAEFIQAEELFKRPITEDNCLRNNRLCGVSNSFVKRSAEGVPVPGTMPQAESAGIPGLAQCRSANQTGTFLQPQQKNSEQASANPALQSSRVTGSRSRTDRSITFDVPTKESHKDKTSLPIKEKCQSGRSSAGIRSSLANLWDRASSKPKLTDSNVRETLATLKTNGVQDSADAQICARENLEAASSDEDESNVNFKRASNDGGNKRRVVLDDSDEEDDEIPVNLGSPDVPNRKSNPDSRPNSRSPEIEKSVLKSVKQEECKPIVKEEDPLDNGSHYAREEFAALCMGKSVKVGISEGISGITPHVDTSIRNKATVAVPSSPKRRKVLKTRIDERGREVTEVEWQAVGSNTKDTNELKSSSNTLKNSNGHSEKIEENVPVNPVSRAATIKKSPAVGSTTPSHAAGKAGGKKKANSKYPKQGNILSFFKKV